VIVHEDWTLADSTQSEYTYVVNDSQTFSLSMDFNTPADPLCQQIVSTFRFENSR
jgi:hypothetical protein